MLDSKLLQEIESLLTADGFALTPGIIERLGKYVELVQHWNERASLVSIGDAGKLWQLHIPDALSLARLVIDEITDGAQWVDIGSGGGLPALPIRILCGELPLTLCERSEKKSGVLREMVSVLDLHGVNILCADFPRQLPHPSGRVVLTARAVERAPQLHAAMAKWLKPGDVFLCQAAEVADPLRVARFHVEHHEDAWTLATLRRGKLWRVTRR